MSNTSNLVLPYLAVGQAQKHVTVNETLRKLDAIIQLSVVSATTTAEPSTPTDGAVYIVPAGKSGAHWSAFANWSLGYYRDGAWVEITPHEGWLAFVKDTDQLLHYTSSAWSLFPAAMILTVSATDNVLGRVSSGAGAAEEIAFTDQAQALCDDTSFGAMRTTLGAAGLADANTFTARQTFSGAFVGIGFTDPAASTNNRMWDMWPAGGEMVARVLSDDLATASAWLQVLRSGASVGAVNFPASGIGVGGHVLPGADNTHNLGSSSFRFATVYAGTGAINTSDARDKTSLRSLSEAERRAITRVFSGAGMFQWLASIEAKGPDPVQGGARLHAGVTAQAVAAAFAEEGLEASSYALFCEDDAGDGATRLGVRYDQLFNMALATLFAGATTRPA